MILGTGYGTDIILIVLGLLVLLLLLQFKSIMFKILAKINKSILPSLYKKDITKLKSHEKVILVYRYWVTRNSL